MLDPRWTKLADVLVNYSTAMKRGEKLLIEAVDVPHEFTCELVRTARAAGADPLVTLKSNRVARALMVHGSEQQMNLIADAEVLRMSNVQAYIGVRGSDNIAELSDVPPDAHKLYQNTIWKRVHQDIRVPKTRWVVLRWPHPAMAQQAGKSTESFEDFYFNVCTMDYAKMARAMKPLVDRMMRTDRVHITGPGTDLAFSIKGIPAIPCDGKVNIPDGEVFTAPVSESVNGSIQFNSRTIYQGTVHDNVRLAFKGGRIVEATSTNSAHLNKVLDTDEGARFIGEFAIGFNPFITEPMLDILFDEKIAGSFHFTPGQAYEIADNGNRSAIHWDMVCMQDDAHGGGEIRFDNEVIRKSGRFTTPDLLGLNPENLR
ncbi:MAG: aminopeptidase [Planctomycetes bacterium]|nr:aminopeptidase [Planctomycetota bacterium]MBI3835495.1 aminopeptidase [Planctomycetota bacterium]